ncbi:MAG: hypothetical protein LBO03_07750 [Acidaminococcales bacterium]|nr:hypothetical protein [Acidaminococcales bacterium]
MKTDPKSLGRPKKSKDRRIGINCYIAGSLLDAMDEYVAERQRKNKGYSRSDFFNEALEKHMRDLGLLQDEAGDGDEKKPG